MVYRGNKLREIIFPLGGIGTGSVGLAGNGSLRDFEIFNRPDKGSLNGYTHIAVKAEQEGRTYCKILNGDLTKDMMGQYSKKTFSGYGFGPDAGTMAGFPHFEDVEFDGRFPTAELTFKDKEFPSEVKLFAFNPMIPHNADDSGIPSAFFEVGFENPTDKPIKYTAYFSLANPFVNSVNESHNDGKHTYIRLSRYDVDIESPEYGDLTIGTDSENAGVQSYWYRGNWQDGIATFYREFSSGKPLPDRKYTEPGKRDTCTLYASVTVLPGERNSVRFVMSWNVPVCTNYWSPDDNGKNSWKNYYTKLFDDSADSCLYSLNNYEKLKKETLLFRDTLYDTTVDECILDAASSSLAVLKSPTVMRLENGEFWGFEGVHEKVGSCEGSCQHVWNYAFALCYLFPELEMSMRDCELKYALQPDGKTSFRIPLPLGRKPSDHRACIDGQMGTVIKIYREWKISGNTKWLCENWQKVKSILNYAWSSDNPDMWDADRDGVLEGRQHHTLDVELFGPSAWLEGIYLCALRAAEKMADALGDNDFSSICEELFEKGYKYTKEKLFNGKWFVQIIDLKNRDFIRKFGDECDKYYWNEETNEIKYQINDGCEIDQMLGQWFAHLTGLGRIFDEEQTKAALDSLKKYNYHQSMRNFVNPWRIFALNDESSTVMCSYPDNTKKPSIPIPYCEESMSGFEYALAGLMIAEGRISDGVELVRAVRNRYDGENRDPFCEIECGSNYARSMAAFALIPISCGFTYDIPGCNIGFDPVIRDGEYRSLFSIGSCYGSYIRENNKTAIIIIHGRIELSSVTLPYVEKIKSVIIDGKENAFEFDNGKLMFERQMVKDGITISYH